MPRDRVLARAKPWATLAAALALVLTACQSLPDAVRVNAWTEADLAGVFDLSELGSTLSIAPTGDHLLLGDRVLPAEVLERFPHMTHGRSHNLLRLSADALLAMAPDAATFLIQAAPAELRAQMSGFGLSLSDLRQAWGSTGELDLAGLLAAAERLDRASARTASGTGHGTGLLEALGVRR